MAGAGGLLVILVGGLIALVLSAGTVVAALYALFGNDAQRGFKWGVAAVVASAISILLSTPFWLVVLRGTDTHGQPLRYPQDWPLPALVVFEAVVFLAAVAGMVRQRMRGSAR